MPVVFDRVEANVAAAPESEASSEPQPAPPPPNEVLEMIRHQMRWLERRRDRLKAD